MAHALASEGPNQGSIRESFFVSQLLNQHKVELSSTADFCVDNKFTFEIGGKGKSRAQIAGMDYSYVVTDDIEFGYQNKIPIWLFGFLY